MKPSARYSILLLGCVTFVLVTPLIIRAVRGREFDPNSQSLVTTGILAVRTDPKDADFYLDGKLQDSTPTSVRFLKPGFYQVKLSKKGYITWEKKLEVKADKVTWISPHPKKLALFLEGSEGSQISTGVTDATSFSDKIFYIKEQALWQIGLQGGTPTKLADLDIKINPTQIQHFRDENIILLKGEGSNIQILNYNTRELFSASLPPDTDLNSIMPTQSGKILYLSGNILFSLDWNTNQTVKLLDKVDSFTRQGDDTYIVTPGDSTSEVFNFSLSKANSEGKVNELTKLASIPKGKISNFTVTDTKAMFLSVDSTFYRVGQSPEPLLDNVNEVSFEATTPSITFTSPSEVWFYDLSLNQKRLITRTNKQLRSFTYRNLLNTVLYIDDTGGKSIELDDRDHPNIFDLLKTEKPRKLFVSSDDDNITILTNDGNLLTTPIR